MSVYAARRCDGPCHNGGDTRAICEIFLHAKSSVPIVAISEKKTDEVIYRVATKLFSMQRLQCIN